SAALFQTDTQDEIVADASSGGRTTYKNAGQTRRRGLELSLLIENLRATVLTSLTISIEENDYEAKYQDPAADGTPWLLLH
ncbi:TonB-dependent receptor domain-containing protein, partial [Pantoea agglomerans]|uniref:TonB-dependent receptor domain-containing protein n=1 Tax=Enterobacter agglomerans TaxID=549 RepID=UPI001F5E25D1